MEPVTVRAAPQNVIRMEAFGGFGSMWFPMVETDVSGGKSRAEETDRKAGYTQEDSLAPSLRGPYVAMRARVV